ncbi:FAD-dependent monooxygenase [Blastomonas fulva]|jgi:salicylate hydroxylase|uniref:FAD-dependent monooxygenase n=1 Tax=Blastomonas fulva TaxID=1550728 RepID=UPI003D29F34B
MSRPAILIVGGGIGGLTAAAGLAQAGFAVTVLEAAPAFGEIGAGVTLSPNAMRGFDFIGCMEEVAAAGVEPKRQRIQHWQDGRALLTLERADAREKSGAPYVYIHRADLHAILVETARKAGVTLRADAAVVSSEGTTVTLANGETVSGDVLVGADGLKSAIRDRFEPVKAHFTGHVAWRAVVPVTEALRPLVDWPGIHIGPGKMITRYPVRGSSLLNMVFFARQPGWQDDGWTIPAESGELRALYADWEPDVQAMIAAAEAVPHFRWALNARQPLESWIADERVTLLGDAAHAMTPFLGHGAACAIEDAVVLARAMAASETPEEGLQRYQAARIERTTFIQAESNANADRMQGQETDLFGLGELRNEETLGLFDYDCRSVAV